MFLDRHKQCGVHHRKNSNAVARDNMWKRASRRTCIDMPGRDLGISRMADILSFAIFEVPSAHSHG